MSRSWLYWSSRGVALAALALFLGTGAVLAQTGSIEGTVRNAHSASPLSGTRVTVAGTQLAATTNPNGYYRIDNVPVGTHQLQAIALGFNAVTVTNAGVTATRVLTVNFEMLPAVINLDAVVVTGVVGETQRAKLAFTVDQVKAEAMPVPQVDALSALQGKVAGAVVMRNSGRPGTAPTILLRGPTSINASGRSQEPLYVVDGVILGSSIVDMDALDIETIEVVKGAAAASLYGSRAASGVVQITTRRGSSLPAEEIRFSARTEYGFNQLPGAFDLTAHHQFRMNASGTKFLQQDGTECDWLACSTFLLAGPTNSQWDTYQVNTWPGTTYDQVDRFFEGGNFSQQYLSAEGRSGSTNFHASWSNMSEGGVMTGQQGMTRNNFRVNVDQSLGQAFEIGASTFYSRSKQDNRSGALFDLTRMPSGVDLMQLNTLQYCTEADPADCPEWMIPRILSDGTQDPNDVYIQPDPFNNESPNPLYSMLNGSSWGYRGRFQASANVRWRPLSWISFMGNLSYDRLDYKSEGYTFKGYKTTTPSQNTNLGNLSRSNSLTETLNWSADVTFTRRFGDLATRTQFRYLAEFDDYDYTNASGQRFAVADVPTMDNLDATTITAGSGLQPVRADGYFGILNLEYKDRYIIDGLVRNDGSSLFGPDSRRQWYYRVAGAWRLTQDLQIPGFDEWKLRAAYGTAGGRPNFAAQYETYSVSGGQVSPVTLGNKNLKPEFSKELEIGTELLVLGRVGLTLNYASTVTEDQLLQVPLPAFAGFTTQWRNAGTLESKTWEATLDMQMVQTRDVTWTAKVLFDRTTQKITYLDVPPYTYGVGGQGMGDVFYAREGESLGTFYGVKYATSCADLLGALDCNEFAVNNDGLLVWVGPGGSLSDPQWGTTGPTFGFRGQNRTLNWGSPVYGWGIDEISGDTTNFLPIGKTTPDFHLGFGTTLRWKGLSVYGLLEWVQGISVYNQPQQWSIFKGYAGIMDQTGIPEADQKPIGYYNALYGIAGLQPANYFVQDASFAKLREVSIRYRFDRAQLASVPFLRVFDGIAISLIGRNLLTFSSYNGYDPESGRNGGDTGSAAIARVDGYDYPNFRTFTAALEVNF